MAKRKTPNRRDLLRASAMGAAGIMTAICLRPTSQSLPSVANRQAHQNEEGYMSTLSKAHLERARELALHLKVDYSDSFVRILATILNAEEIEMVMALPSTTASVAQAIGRDEKAVADALHQLYLRGVIIPTTEGDQLLWTIPEAGSLMDSILLDSRYDYLGEPFRAEWREFYHEAVVHSPPDHALRVLPIEATISLEQMAGGSQVLPVESARAVVESARRIVVQRCPCRTREGRCDAPLEMCFSFNEVADYVLERGLGREINVEEALAILAQAENLGLIHQTNNSGQPYVLCNCCPCCCSLLRAIITYGVRNASVSSRFRPVVEEELCTNCLACVEACHFSAMFEEGGTRRYDADLCMGCGQCAHVCPVDAITLVEALPAGHTSSGRDSSINLFSGD